MTAMLPPCGLTHHDEPPNDVSGWCAHWAKHGAQVLTEKAAHKLRMEAAHPLYKVREVMDAGGSSSQAWFLVGRVEFSRAVNPNFVFVNEGQ